MAEKKTASRAEQAVSGAKKKTSSGSASKPSGKKSTPAKNTKYKTEYERAVPPHFLIAAVSILLFALFVVISVNPDGKLLVLIQSVVLGLVCAVVQYYKVPILKRIVTAYIELSRNTPLLVQLFFLYYGLPKIGIQTDAVTCGIAGLAFLGGSYMAEAFRSGLEAVAEIQTESAEMANRSVLLNELEERVSIKEGDIKEAVQLFGASSFDVVTSNPPYMNEGGGLVNPFAAKAIARHEILCSLEDVVAAAARLLRPLGRFYMIHRPHRLTDIMVLLRQYRLEPKRIRFVQPYADKEPTMVLVEAARGGKPMVKVDAPLVIYQAPQEYTEEIVEIYYGKGQA